MREVRGEKRADLADAGDDAVDEATVAKRRFHSCTDRLPRTGRHLTVDAAIGDDLDVAIGKQEVNEDAGVLLGVPDAKQTEHLERALARREVPQHAKRRQRAFDGEAYLAAVATLACGNRVLD